MVYFGKSVIGAAALLASLVSAAPRPRPDSAVGDEVAVSAPDGIILSDTAELSSQLASESAAAASSAYYPAMTTSSDYAAMTTAAAAYGSQGGYDSGYAAPSSSAAWDSAPVYSSSSSEYVAATSTSSAYVAAMTYGSGSSNWGGSGYNDCVNQCVASFGAPPPMYTPTPSSSDSGSSGSGSGSSGTGTTITVIVAPTQGVLRYVPFAVNASVGDTIHFMWNANNHTVTKSSELQICNKTSDAPFVSGTHDKGFTFDQVVNDTATTFFYCGTPGHCEKGMFGIINPPSSINANTSVGSMMSSMVSSSPSLSAAWSYASNKTAGNLKASTWGQSIDLAKIPTWAHGPVMENVLYAQSLIGMNPDVLTTDGKVDMNANGNALMFPTDVAAAVNNGASAGSALSSAGISQSTGAPVNAAPAASSSAASPSQSAASNSNSNGARSTAVSSALLGAGFLAATFLAL